MVAMTTISAADLNKSLHDIGCVKCIDIIYLLALIVSEGGKWYVSKLICTCYLRYKPRWDKKGGGGV